MQKIFEHDSENSKSRETDELVFFDSQHSISPKSDDSIRQVDSSSSLSSLNRFGNFNNGSRTSISDTYLSKRIKTVKDFRISLDNEQLDQLRNIMKEEFKKVRFKFDYY